MIGAFKDTCGLNGTTHQLLFVDTAHPDIDRESRSSLGRLPGSLLDPESGALDSFFLNHLVALILQKAGSYYCRCGCCNSMARVYVIQPDN